MIFFSNLKYRETLRQGCLLLELIWHLFLILATLFFSYHTYIPFFLNLTQVYSLFLTKNLFSSNQFLLNIWMLCHNCHNESQTNFVFWNNFLNICKMCNMVLICLSLWLFFSNMCKIFVCLQKKCILSEKTGSCMVRMDWQPAPEGLAQIIPLLKVIYRNSGVH